MLAPIEGGGSSAMPQRPDDLSRIIKEIAQRQASKRGAVFDDAALERIGVVPPPYGFQPTITVNLGDLEDMISDIVEIARRYDKTITLPVIEKALREVKCHYLWFC